MRAARTCPTMRKDARRCLPHRSWHLPIRKRDAGGWCSLCVLRRLDEGRPKLEKVAPFARVLCTHHLASLDVDKRIGPIARSPRSDDGAVVQLLAHHRLDGYRQIAAIEPCGCLCVYSASTASRNDDRMTILVRPLIMLSAECAIDRRASCEKPRRLRVESNRINSSRPATPRAHLGCTYDRTYSLAQAATSAPDPASTQTGASTGSNLDYQACPGKARQKVQLRLAVQRLIMSLMFSWDL